MSEFSTKAEWYRFSLRGLLLTTALLAMCLAWPVLFIFVLPIFIAAVFGRRRLNFVISLVAATILSMGLGVVFSLLYWNYVFSPPAMLTELRAINSVEQLSRVSDMDPRRNRTPAVQPIASIPPDRMLDWNTSSELLPTQRILQELGHRGVAIESSQPVSLEILDSISCAAEKHRLLIDGEPGYSDTKLLNGYAGRGRLVDGTEVVFATMMGDQQSNDHYPYYEIVLRPAKDGFEMIDFQWFFFDIAGIEGCTWAHVAVLSYAVLGPIALCIAAITDRSRFLLKRLRRGAT